MNDGNATRTIRAASVIVQREDGALLLVKRRNPPQMGLWSVPGGKVEGDESLREAAAREAFEETGLHVRVGDRLWVVTIPAGDGSEYEVHDFAATVTGGILRAGDDAARVRWVPAAELSRIPLVVPLLGYLQKAGIAP